MLNHQREKKHLMFVLDQNVFPLSITKLGFHYPEFDKSFLDKNQKCILPANLNELILIYTIFSHQFTHENGEIFLPESVKIVKFCESKLLFPYYHFETQEQKLKFIQTTYDKLSYKFGNQWPFEWCFTVTNTDVIMSFHKKI